MGNSPWLPDTVSKVGFAYPSNRNMPPESSSPFGQAAIWEVNSKGSRHWLSIMDHGLLLLWIIGAAKSLKYVCPLNLHGGCWIPIFISSIILKLCIQHRRFFVVNLLLWVNYRSMLLQHQFLLNAQYCPIPLEGLGDPRMLVTCDRILRFTHVCYFLVEFPCFLGGFPNGPSLKHYHHQINQWLNLWIIPL